MKKKSIEKYVIKKSWTESFDVAFLKHFNYIGIMSRIEVLKQHYEPRLKKYSENSKVLDWENAEAQYKRFRAMTDNLDLNAKSVLDVGCGCGDLFGLLKKEEIDLKYTGVDILEKMIERAVTEYPDGEFLCDDVFRKDFCVDESLGCSRFDITFTSGIFNLNAGNNEEFLKKAVPVLAELADEAFVFNLLDPSSPDRDENYFYYEPEKAIELASEYAGSIRHISGYLDNDYTLICMK